MNEKTLDDMADPHLDVILLRIDNSEKRRHTKNSMSQMYSHRFVSNYLEFTFALNSIWQRSKCQHSFFVLQNVHI